MMRLIFAAMILLKLFSSVCHPIGLKTCQLLTAHDKNLYQQNEHTERINFLYKQRDTPEGLAGKHALTAALYVKGSLTGVVHFFDVG